MTAAATTPMGDHYNLLGVTRESSRDEIRGAYKMKALALHPDKNPNGEALFKLIVNAYQTLISPSKKCAYDRELDLKETRRPAYGAPPSRPREQPPRQPFRQASKGDNPPSGRNDENRDVPKAPPRQTPGGFQSEFRREPHVPPPPPEDHGSFADWFRKKQEEFRKAEEVSAAKAEYARQLEEEERAKAEAYRKLQRERERERETEMEGERERRRREQEHMHKEQESKHREEKAKASQARLAEFYEQQRQQQASLDTHMQDLAKERDALRVRREKLAADKRAADLAGQTATDGVEFRMKQKLREEEIAEELRKAEVKAKEVREMYEIKRRDEERQSQLREETRRREEAERVEREAHFEREANRAAAEEAAKEVELAKQKSAFGQQRRRVMDDVLAERKKHDEEMQAMRRETDRIEAEMRAKLDALRAAKREGRPINTDEFKL